MKPIKNQFLIAAVLLCSSLQAQTPEEQYINRWKNFYPTKALNQGIHTSIFDFEDFSLERIDEWVQFNQNFLGELESNDNMNSINARLLRTQVQNEIHLWKVQKPQESSLMLYTSLITSALEKIDRADYLLPDEKGILLCERLQGIYALASQAKNNLKSSPEGEIDRGQRMLTSMFAKIQSEINFSTHCPSENAEKAIEAIRNLVSHVQSNVRPESNNQIIGKEEYNRRLKLYTDSDLNFEQMEKLALQEIDETKELILNTSKDYIQSHYGSEGMPGTTEEIISLAFSDMEKDAPASGREYLEFWQELSQAAIDFIEQNEIATLPEVQTLRIINAPESAGAAARIGWVSSAPPFHPNPVTTLYLPSIPESLPEQEKIDFWSSFNKPFNRMIVIHELFPGHYMQIKISRGTAHPVRLLFPYRPYIEGWATFTERVLLDAGWEEERPLSFLAHLRKRLENANRAYTSVQVHCNGWTEEQVMEFSTETSLLAPQFAKSLWGRIMRSPMQLTSYFYGGRQFSELLKSEKQRLGEDFVLKTFMDTIMKAGPIPVDEFPSILAVIE